MKFFFLLTFAAAIPAIVSGGIAERAQFNPQIAATFLLVGFLYPFFERIAWNQALRRPGRGSRRTFGEEFHDFAGSVVVHAVGGWVALAAVILLGPRLGRYGKDGRVIAFPPSSIPFLALGAWVLVRRLVRVQRDERADHRQDLGPGGDELAHGDGGRHASRASSSGATTRASCTTARSRGWWRSAPAPT